MQMLNLWKWRANQKGLKHPAGGSGTNPLRILKGDCIRLLEVVTQLTDALKFFLPLFVSFWILNVPMSSSSLIFSSVVSNLQLILSIVFFCLRHSFHL